MEEKAYSINSARAISETLDGETIIINLDTGNYYSINATATFIWQQLATLRTTTQLVQDLATHYDAPLDTLQKSVDDSLAFLLTEQLIVEMPTSEMKTPGASETITEKNAEQNTQTAEKNTAPQNPVPTSTKKSFTPAKIDKYDDMQEMLLADPIHDVDASGWPQLKK